MCLIKLTLLGLAWISVEGVHAENLVQVYQQATEADPTLKSADAQVEIVSAQKGQALGQLLPQISGSANWSENKQTVNARNGGQSVESNYPGTRFYVSLNQSIIDFAKFWNWRRSQEVETQFELQRKAAQQTSMYNVVERYFIVLEAEDQLKFLQTELAATQSQFQQTQKQYSKQLVKVTDVYEVEARLDRIQADIIEAESLVSSAKQALRELTNINNPHLYTLKEEIEYKELEGKLEDWIQVALSDNPALAALHKAIDAADSDVAAQKSKHLPVVDLQLNYYNTDTGFQSTRTPEIQTQVAAINVNVPIFSGGTTTQQVFEAQSRLALSKHEDEAKLREIVKETSDAFLTSNANVKRIKASMKALESAQKAHKAMDISYKYGVATIGEVLVTQQAEFKAKRDLAQSKYSYIKNRFRFLQAIGTINEDNIHEANDWLAPSTGN